MLASGPKGQPTPLRGDPWGRKRVPNVLAGSSLLNACPEGVLFTFSNTETCSFRMTQTRIMDRQKLFHSTDKPPWAMWPPPFATSLATSVTNAHRHTCLFIHWRTYLLMWLACRQPNIHALLGPIWQSQDLSATFDHCDLCCPMSLGLFTFRNYELGLYELGTYEHGTCAFI